MRIITGLSAGTRRWFLSVRDKPDRMPKENRIPPEILRYTEMTVQSYLRFIAKIKGVTKARLANEIDRSWTR
jgi:ABC-type uncharacterized transport system ATPase subunit